MLRSRFRSALLALAAAVVVSAGAASSAHAQVPIIVDLSVSGSGTITGFGGCGAGDKPNGTITTGCAPAINVRRPLGIPAIMQIFAAPQANGGWTFVRWETNAPCAPLSPACVFASFGGAFTARAVFEDHTVPVLSALSGGQVASKDGTASFGWTTNETLKGAECAVDAGAFTACSAKNSSSVSATEGTHTFRVQGHGHLRERRKRPHDELPDHRDRARQRPGRHLERQVADVRVLSHGPAGTAFECSLDSVALADCGPKGADNRGSKQFTNLSEGNHTFRVRAKDGPVNDPSTLVRTWRVDSVAPIAALDKDTGPGEGALQAINTETFNFTANEPSTFQCRLDSADFADCGAPVTLEHLKAGQHQFDVRAIDQAGNVGAAVSRKWSVAANDDDNDGFNAQIDCNDGDPSIRPGALEVLDNAVDENCDGVIGKTPVVVAEHGRSRCWSRSRSSPAPRRRRRSSRRLRSRTCRSARR